MTTYIQEEKRWKEQDVRNAGLFLARNKSKSGVNSSLQEKIITTITSVNIYGVLILI